MDFSPRFHEPALLLMKIAANELEGVDREDPDLVLVVRVEVRPMVGRCRLGEHTDDDPKESGDLRRPTLESPQKVALSRATPTELSHTETLRSRLSLGQRAELDTRAAPRSSPA
jgi:hypothetical protein